MNSYKTWSVDVADPKLDANVRHFLSNHSGAISVATAIERLSEMLQPFDSVSLTADDGQPFEVYAKPMAYQLHELPQEIREQFE